MSCCRSFSRTLLNNQSLVANPPTRTTCLNTSLRQRATTETEATDRYRFVSHLALVQHSLDDALNRGLKELSHIGPQEFELAESDIAALVVILCSAKFDILIFARISKPEFCGLVKAFDNVV